MGKRDEFNQSSTIPMPPAMERRLIAPCVSGERGAQFVAFLEENPAAAKIMGAMTKRARESFAKAYPGQTRTTAYPAKTWEAEGNTYYARAMRLMGFTKF